MSVLYKILAVVLAVFVFSPSGEVASYAPLSREEMQFSFTVLSDGHMEGNSSEKHTLYGEGFRDMASAEVQSRALVMLGDNTMNGQVFENAILYGLLRKYNTVDTVLMAVGNHDICPGKHNQGDYDTLRERFIRFNNTFLDNQIDELYYARIIEGCYFIVLASDCDAGVAQYISPEQFEWLEGVLKEADKSGKPVFLFSHWPLNHVFSKVWQEGHVGEQSDELHALLQKYDNRIFSLRDIYIWAFMKTATVLQKKERLPISMCPRSVRRIPTAMPMCRIQVWVCKPRCMQTRWLYAYGILPHTNGRNMNIGLHIEK